MRDEAEVQIAKSLGEPAVKPEAPGTPVFVALMQRWSTPRGFEVRFGPFESVSVSSGPDASGGSPLLVGVEKSGRVVPLATLTAGMKWRPVDPDKVGFEFGAVLILPFNE